MWAPGLLARTRPRRRRTRKSEGRRKGRGRERREGRGGEAQLRTELGNSNQMGEGTYLNGKQVIFYRRKDEILVS